MNHYLKLKRKIVKAYEEHWKWYVLNNLWADEHVSQKHWGDTETEKNWDKERQHTFSMTWHPKSNVIFGYNLFRAFIMQ